MPLGPQRNAIFAGGAPFEATGGTVTTSGIYTIHTFTATDDFVVEGSSGNVDMFILAGGGTGGFSSAPGGKGGGAGGFQYFPAYEVTVGTHTCTIGAGGTASGGGSSPVEQNGTNTTFSNPTLTSYKGQSPDPPSLSGSFGSGGGNSRTDQTLNQGNRGATWGYAGGGAAEAGATDGAGHGGDGYTEGSSAVYDWTKNDSSSTATFDVNGTGNSYGGGGSGHGQAGGLGGGGSSSSGGGSGGSGSANTGGGGGGGDDGGGGMNSGGNGGSGIVIIRYPT